MITYRCVFGRRWFFIVAHYLRLAKRTLLPKNGIRAALAHRTYVLAFIMRELSSVGRRVLVAQVDWPRCIWFADLKWVLHPEYSGDSLNTLPHTDVVVVLDRACGYNGRFGLVFIDGRIIRGLGHVEVSLEERGRHCMTLLSQGRAAGVRRVS